MLKAYKKQIQIITSEPLLLLAFPLSLLPLLLMIVLRPLILIRVGFLRCDRIGHFAANTEVYLCEKKESPSQKRVLDIFYYPRPLCNKQLAKMWERQVLVFPWFLIRPLCLLVRSFGFLSVHSVKEGSGADRDINNLFDKYPPSLSFTDDETARGLSEMKKMGIPEDAPFVCLIIRDNAYLKNLYKLDASYHNFRNSNIDDYVQAAERLAERGYFVIRMGSAVNNPLKSAHPKVLDYATNGMRSDFMDIFLGANCAFCISTLTGFDSVPFIFRRPIVYVNVLPIGWLFTFSDKFLGIFKHHFVGNKELSLSEIVDRGAGFCANNDEYDQLGITLKDNHSEEIADVVMEMADRYEGKWMASQEDVILQKKFWSKYPKDVVGINGNPLHGDIRSSYGASFLRKNQWFVS